MIKSLRQLVASKVRLQKDQLIFKENLDKTYPNLIKKDVSILLNKIDKEFNVLLSSSVLYKTGEVKIPVINRWSSIIKLTRNPGLKAPYHSWSDVNFQEVQSILSSGDLVLKTKHSDKENIVRLGILKNHPKLKQDKIEKFYIYLEKALKIEKPLKELYQKDFYDKKTVIPNVKIKGYKIVMLKMGFEILVQEDLAEGSELTTWRSSNMDDYELKRTYLNNPSLPLQEKIAKFYPQIHEALLKLDKQKEKCIVRLEKFLEKIKEENRAFMVLGKLSG